MLMIGDLIKHKDKKQYLQIGVGIIVDIYDYVYAIRWLNSDNIQEVPRKVIHEHFATILKQQNQD